MLKRTKEEEEAQKSRLQNLQERLYSQNNPTVFRDRRSVIHSDSESVASEWQTLPQEESEELSLNEEQKSRAFSKFSHVIFYGAFLFLFGALLFSVYHFVWGVKSVSADKIAVTVDAPSFINGGEVFPLTVYVQNQNKSALEKVDLIIEYPKGEKITSQEEADLKRVPLGNITPGATVKGTTDIVLYGREGNVRDIKISLEYYVAGSSVVLKKDISHSLTLKAAPVVLTTESFKEIASNQEFTLKTHIRAERGIDLNNFLLKVEYPNGFQFVSSDPAPRFGNNVWTFDKIEKGTVMDVTIKGIIRGEDGDERVFRVAGGSPDLADNSQLGIVYADTKSSVVVQKPFISLVGGYDARKDFATGEFALQANTRTQGYFEYQNNIGDTISNVIVTAKLSGEILNRQKISVSNGSYDSSRNIITWDRTTVPALASLLPGQKGVLKFYVQSYPLNAKQNGYFSQPVITAEAQVTGKRLSDTQVPEQNATSLPLIAKIITEAGIKGEILGADAPSGSSLLQELVSEKTSTYTLSLGVLNRSSTLSNPKVTFVLPLYVNFTGKVEPQTENVTYDTNTRTITWLPQVIVPDTGFGKPEKKVYIGLSVLPSIGNIGSKLLVTDSVVLTADDSYSGVPIKTDTGQIFFPVIVK
jgi:hypothetical protein